MTKLTHLAVACLAIAVAVTISGVSSPGVLAAVLYLLAGALLRDALR